MAKLRINGDSSGYVDLEAPNAASSSTLDLDQVPQKNAANTFSAINKFTDSVAIGTSNSPTNNLDIRSTGQAIVRVDGTGLYYNGIKIRNNYSSVQSDWNIGAAGGTSGWGSANGNFIIRDDTTNSTGLEIEQGAGSNTAALHIDSSGAVTKPNQPCFSVRHSGVSSVNATGGYIAFTSIGDTFINQGNHFTSSNGRFTAPVAGNYLFGCTMRYDSFTDQYFYVTILKNNGNYGVRDLKSLTGNYLHASVHVILPMAVNDYVYVQLNSNNDSSVNINDDTNFYGYLLG